MRQRTIDDFVDLSVVINRIPRYEEYEALANEADIPIDEARDHIDGFTYALQAMMPVEATGRTRPEWLKKHAPDEDIKVNWSKEGF